MVGRPGSSASNPAAPAAIISGLTLDPSCSASLPCILPSMAPLDTTMPAAVETSRAGICDTRPSPMVRVVKVESALSIDICARSRPIARPPKMLIRVITSAEIASPRTNLLAPSIAP